MTVLAFSSNASAYKIVPQPLEVVEAEGTFEISRNTSVFVTDKSLLPTAHYLADRLDGYPVKLSALSRGVPVGGELDYLDDGTLQMAFKSRRGL